MTTVTGTWQYLEIVMILEWDICYINLSSLWNRKYFNNLLFSFKQDSLLRAQVTCKVISPGSTSTSDLTSPPSTSQVDISIEIGSLRDSVLGLLVMVEFCVQLSSQNYFLTLPSVISVEPVLPKNIYLQISLPRWAGSSVLSPPKWRSPCQPAEFLPGW